MISDNATIFQGAAEELKNLCSSETVRAVQNREEVTWRFILRKAPCFGGYWERLVGLTKTAIKKLLGRAHILQMLQTVALEDRPLTYVSHDPKDPEPLTPSHLLDEELQICHINITM